MARGRQARSLLPHKKITPRSQQTLTTVWPTIFRMAYIILIYRLCIHVITNHLIVFTQTILTYCLATNSLPHLPKALLASRFLLTAYENEPTKKALKKTSGFLALPTDRNINRNICHYSSSASASRALRASSLRTFAASCSASRS